MDKDKIQKMREIMGTVPGQAKKKTNFFDGVEGITCKMIDHSKNPYKAMFAMATSTWGTENEWSDKWSRTPVEGRINVVKAVLEGSTLPLALEEPSFCFEISGVSRASFDQTARVRIGAALGSMGVRDNSRIDAGFRIPNELSKNGQLKAEIIAHITAIKDLYGKIIENKGSWQAARAVLPMGMTHNFTITINYMSLRGQCARRLCFAEQEDTVATFWLMREELKKKFPWLAAWLRPACDFRGKCLYHKSYSMSEMFGCLFKECGRNPCDATDEYALFNNACSDKKTIESQLMIQIPEANEEKPESFEPTELDMEYLKND